jgi:hypothetical protein
LGGWEMGIRVVLDLRKRKRNKIFSSGSKTIWEKVKRVMVNKWRRIIRKKFKAILFWRI